MKPDIHPVAPLADDDCVELDHHRGRADSGGGRGMAVRQDVHHAGGVGPQAMLYQTLCILYIV